MPFDREKYYDSVRASLFSAHMSKAQVQGQDEILSAWEKTREGQDLRFLAYELATTKHETAATMLPIEEYGKGKGQPYGQIDQDTGQRYYGRGYVQLTWKENYAKMSKVTSSDLVNHPEGALLPSIAAEIMFTGMEEGMFRPPHKLSRYFNDEDEDAFAAREIINGDKSLVPKWSGGDSIGEIIEEYYAKFLMALRQSQTQPAPEPEPMVIRIIVPEGVTVKVETA